MTLVGFSLNQTLRLLAEGSLVLFCFSFTSKAQIEKAGILLGGVFGYSNSSNKQPPIPIKVNPSMQIFI
jgi:hypothetical protein